MENSVLVVDDNPHFSDILGEVLRDGGFAATCCLSAEEALRQARAKRFRVVVTDYRMPGMLGTELASVLRSRFPDIFIIGISMDCREAEFLAAGANVFLSKPFQEHDIISLVRQGVQTRPARAGEQKH